MGSRFFLSLTCAYCGEFNENVYYAESSDIMDFRCKKCKKVNFISMEFRSAKAEKCPKCGRYFELGTLCYSCEEEVIDDYYGR